MDITYDREADAINISLREGKVSRTFEVAPEIIVDVDKSGRTLSLEIIGASEKIDKKKLNTLTVDGHRVRLPAGVR